jgi:hypothetical protein
LHPPRGFDSIDCYNGLKIMGSERLGCATAIASAVLVTTLMLRSSDAVARVACEGHQLLAVPRAASSCNAPRPSSFPSPDRALTAVVVPADPSLHATPDMESRIDIKSRSGRIRASKDYSSPGGANGYYVVRAKWTPDSQFFVYSLSSSGGHSPWQSPMAVYRRAANTFVSFSDLIGGNPTLSPNFKMIGAHGITTTTWREQNIERSRQVTVDLRDAMSKLPARP